MKSTNTLAILAGLIAAAGTVQQADAQPVPTKITIRAVAHDAKIIGSHVGGARITVIDAVSRDTLATGIQTGSTGNTRAIMVEPRIRGTSIYDTEGAAGFVAELQLTQPTLVELVAEGPLGTSHAMQRATKTMWVIPGQDVLGDGIVLELFGFTVVVDTPASGETVTAGEDFEIRARVTMLCGCPTEPGGLWNADDIDVIARLTLDGSRLRDIPLEYANATSTYHAWTSVAHAGHVEIEIIAMDAGKGNFGIAKQSLDVGN